MTAPDAMRAKYTVTVPTADTYVTFLDTDAMLRDLTRLTQIETAARHYRNYVEGIAEEAYDDWDSDRDSKVGKALMALFGRRGMRPQLDALRDTLDTLTPTGGAKDE